jgi:hypothetical protein
MEKKYKLAVEIHNTGSANDSIIRMVTNHNAGKVEIDLDLIKMVLKGKYAEFPTITPEFKVVSQLCGRIDIFEIIGKKETATLSVIETDIPLPSEEEAINTEAVNQ